MFASRFGRSKQQLEKTYEEMNSKRSQAAEFPFDSSIKRMTVVYDRDSSAKQLRVYSKGAVERILERCTQIESAADKEVRDFTDADEKDILARMDDLASQGLRVLALAKGDISRDFDLLPLSAVK